jgi:hypothetical protein
MGKTAMVTLCVGKEFTSLWDRYCRAGWENYARRHGYDLKAFTSPVDMSTRAAGRTVAWQKCLVLEALADYERVLWVDADIVINREAPAVTVDVPMGKVGAVISGSYIHPDLRMHFLRRTIRPTAITATDEREAWRNDQASFYAEAGITCASPEIVQSGVLVMDASHRGLMREVYESYPAGLRYAEQLPLSAALLNSGVLHRMDSKFNTVFLERAVVHYTYLFDPEIQKNAIFHQLASLAVQAELNNSYFLHFALEPKYMRYVPV